jgi:hypothetical protein
VGKESQREREKEKKEVNNVFIDFKTLPDTSFLSLIETRPEKCPKFG